MAIVKVPKILIPNKSVDMARWATVACDQFTSEPEYWKELDAFVGKSPSTLRLTFPEVFLSKVGETAPKTVQAKMNEYISDGIFEEIEGIVLVEREVAGGKRFGIVCAIDLEEYDFNRVLKPIRATEDTILSRLPIRVAIRNGAKLELPHAIILMDDGERQIIEPLIAKRQSYKKLYDFDLNMNGGNIKGYLIDNPADVIAKISALGNPEKQVQKYGFDAGIALAIGDGNHSIATAKVYWNELKGSLNPEEIANHPARYALVEIVNIYGDGMDFEPIHRMVIGADDAFVNELKNRISGDGQGQIKIMHHGGKTESVKAFADAAMTIKAVQSYIEETLKNGKIKVDYIHGEGHLKEVVSSTDGAIGIVMPKFPADRLFGYVAGVGNLPKKAFSIGEAHEKRYYLEGRYIVKNPKEI